MSKIALIAAVAEKGAIGRDQQLLCHLPNDLKHFKTLTSGHTVVMGRKTFESLPNGALPNRKNIVLTHNTSLSWPNVTVVHTLDEIPIQDTTEDEIFIMGGATLYKETIKIADTLYITHIHHTFDDADTFFPTINPSEWEIANSQEMPADEKHAYPYTFVTYTRRRIENNRVNPYRSASHSRYCRIPILREEPCSTPLHIPNRNEPLRQFRQ